MLCVAPHNSRAVLVATPTTFIYPFSPSKYLRMPCWNRTHPTPCQMHRFLRIGGELSCAAVPIIHGPTKGAELLPLRVPPFVFQRASQSDLLWQNQGRQCRNSKDAARVHSTHRTKARSWLAGWLPSRKPGLSSLSFGSRPHEELLERGETIEYWGLQLERGIC